MKNMYETTVHGVIVSVNLREGTVRYHNPRIVTYNLGSKVIRWIENSIQQILDDSVEERIDQADEMMGIKS